MARPPINKRPDINRHYTPRCSACGGANAIPPCRACLGVGTREAMNLNVKRIIDKINTR